MITKTINIYTGSHRRLSETTLTMGCNGCVACFVLYSSTHLWDKWPCHGLPTTLARLNRKLRWGFACDNGRDVHYGHVMLNIYLNVHKHLLYLPLLFPWSPLTFVLHWSHGYSLVQNKCHWIDQVNWWKY